MKRTFFFSFKEIGQAGLLNRITGSTSEQLGDEAAIRNNRSLLEILKLVIKKTKNDKL